MTFLLKTFPTRVIQLVLPGVQQPAATWIVMQGDAVGDSTQPQSAALADTVQAASSDDCSAVNLVSPTTAQDSATSLPDEAVTAQNAQQAPAAKSQVEDGTIAQQTGIAQQGKAQRAQQAFESHALGQPALYQQAAAAAAAAAPRRQLRKRKQPLFHDEQAMPNASTPVSTGGAASPAVVVDKSHDLAPADPQRKSKRKASKVPPQHSQASAGGKKPRTTSGAICSIGTTPAIASSLQLNI